MKRQNLSDQVAELLLNRIQTGVYKSSNLLPSIVNLSNELNVSRSTIREALSRLETLGLVEVHHGKGVKVTESKIDFSSRVKSFSETVREQGKFPGGRVLEKGIVQADPVIAERLGIQPSENVIYLSRLRLADGLPLAIENSFMPCELFPALLEQAEIEKSLYELFRNIYGHEVTYAVRTIEAVLTTPEENKLLGLHGRQPALLIETLAMDINQRPVEYGKSLYRADRFKFVVQQTKDKWSA